MKKLINYLLFTILFSGIAFSQQITGIVFDSETGSPLPGATVVVKGTDVGTNTDFDGNFVLPNVGMNSIIVVSYLGYKSKDVEVVSQNIVQVSLVSEANALDEIVVLGYGVQNSKKVSGAVSSVSAESISKLQPTRIEDALQGSASGVNIITNPNPGAGATVIIRGISSNSGNAPLVVIDGVPQSLSDLNALPPSDISKIDILKDASTAALYGSRGGNGVILVTTKSGFFNQPVKFTFNSSYGMQQVLKTIDVLNATEYASILNEASVASGGSLIYPNLSGLGEGTDWQDSVINDAPLSNQNLSISGGTDSSKYYLSGAFSGTEGVVAGGAKSYFDRLNLTGNFTSKINDKLTAVFNTTYTNIKGSNVNPLNNALNFDPTVPLLDNNQFGISNTITQEIINPLAQLNDTYNKDNTNKFNGKFEIQYELIDGLKVTSRLGYTYADVFNKSFTPLRFYGVGHNQTTANADLTPIFSTDPETGEVTQLYHNSVTESKNNYWQATYEIFGNYNFQINELNNFDVVLGYSIYKAAGSGVSATQEDILENSWEFADITAATGTQEQARIGNYQYESRNLSYIARIDYDYNEKYLAAFTIRRDGSKNFGNENKFGYFPSASVGWIASSEDFFNLKDVSFLKIRASYGTVGNDTAYPQYSRISTFPKYVFNGSINTGSTLLTIPNNALSWENQIQQNYGIDLRFFEDKFSLSTDYYIKSVDDLLFNPTLSGYLGIPQYPIANIGSTETQGIDASISYNNIFKNGLSISASATFSTFDSKVTAINNGEKYIWLSGYGIPYKNLTRFEEGESPGYFFGYVTDGIFQSQSEIDNHANQPNAAPGDIRFKDLNGDGVIDDLDRKKIGDPFAEYTIGFNFNLEYQGFDFFLTTYASVGNDIYRAYERNLNYTNRFASSLDRWRGPGTSNTEPRATFIDSNNNLRQSDRYVEDGSYFRIRNLELGYSLPKSSFDTIGIDKVRIYAQAKNLATFTEYSGYDPEISNGVFDTGIDRGTYPLPRIVSLGFNITF